MAPPIGFSEGDVAVLRALIDREKTKPYETQNRPFVYEQIAQAPDVYVAISPSGGIPERDEEFPGSAICKIYRILDDLLEDTGILETVYNISSWEIPEGSYVVVTQERFGTWVATGRDDQSLVCTSTTITEVDLRCITGILKRYARSAILNIVAGCLVRTYTAWAYTGDEGCCDCEGVIPVVTGTGTGTNDIIVTTCCNTVPERLCVYIDQLGGPSANPDEPEYCLSLDGANGMAFWTDSFQSFGFSLTRGNSVISGSLSCESVNSTCASHHLTSIGFHWLFTGTVHCPDDSLLESYAPCTGYGMHIVSEQCSPFRVVIHLYFGAPAASIYYLRLIFTEPPCVIPLDYTGTGTISSGPAETGTGGGSSTVTFCGIPNVETSLSASISNGSGCSAMVSSFKIGYSSALPSFDGDRLLGVGTVVLSMRCSGSTFTIQGTCGGGSFNGVGTLISSEPFQVQFNSVIVMSGCCTGSINITVTE